MAPLSSPDSSQSRFGGGLCSTSMAPALPASGFAFPHLQRLLQSSAADSSFQIQEQVGQFYLPQKTQPTLGYASAEAPRSGSSSAETAVADPARDPAQLGQAFQSYGQEAAEGPAILPTLMRYHSAPSSVLANFAGMASAVINSNSDYGQFLPNNMVAELNPDLKRKGKHSLDHIDNQGSMGAAPVDQLENHRNEFVAAQGPYQHPIGGDGELLSQRSVGADNVPLLRSPGAPSEVGKAALQSPNQKSRFMYSKQNYEDGLQRMPLAKDGLLRHSSSPPGFFSQLNDEQERHILASSSGNSSEEGSYERQGCHGLFNGCSYDDTGNMAAGHVDGSPAARKRVRDLSGKNYSGSTFLESQKPDAFGNYFGMPITGSPENTYLTEKVSSDSILCRTRAKRGCATHPRSIAERVRRTKISERMKKLQELVPHMDKQANYAEMLDEAVEYVKCLQRQVKELMDNQSKCNCACGKPKESISSSK